MSAVINDNAIAVGQVLSVNIGSTRKLTWEGRTTRTGIFKFPVEGKVNVYRLGIEGDKQADLRVHGGPRKAVYAYPAAHYQHWRERYPDKELPWGAFGENLTIDGLDEQSARAGERFLIGNVVLEVTTPRQPCFKLAMKFEDHSLIKHFLAQGRTGFYMSVVQKGSLQSGDTIKRLAPWT